jgi:hypothetical protein
VTRVSAIEVNEDENRGGSVIRVSTTPNESDLINLKESMLSEERQKGEGDEE